MRWATVTGGLGHMCTACRGHLTAGAHLLEATRDRGALSWLAGPAGAFLGSKGLLMWPKYVCHWAED